MENLDTESLIPPLSLKRFLAANRWAILEDRDNEWEIWRSSTDRHTTVTLVFDHEYADYGRRLAEANDTIARSYKLTLAELAEQITALTSDLFFLRIQQDSRDGTISFKQAQRALDSIATMVRAAATSVASPTHSHQGKRPAQVNDFLAEDLRLGHTKQGSFVVTAAARLDHSEPNIKAESGSEAVDATPGTEIVSVADPDQIQPFGRRVMTMFSRSLEAARKLAIDEETVLSAVEKGLSLELAEALEGFSKEEGLQTLEVSFDWSESVPAPPADVPAVIKFERPILDSLPQVTEQLQARQMPETVTLTGPVRVLSRKDSENEEVESGEVTVVAEINGRMRKVLVNLEGQAHEYAIRAYRDKFPITVSGELVKRRSWQLEGYVTMDLEAAKFLADRTTVNNQARRTVPPNRPVEPEADNETGEHPGAGEAP